MTANISHPLDVGALKFRFLVKNGKAHWPKEISQLKDGLWSANFKKVGERRSTRSNSYLWVVNEWSAGRFSDMYGETFTQDDAHYLWKQIILSKPFITPNGVTVNVPTKRTRDMSKGEMQGYFARMNEKAIEFFGEPIPEPNEY